MMILLILAPMIILTIVIVIQNLIIGRVRIAKVVVLNEDQFSKFINMYRENPKYYNITIYPYIVKLKIEQILNMSIYIKNDKLEIYIENNGDQKLCKHLIFDIYPHICSQYFNGCIDPHSRKLFCTINLRKFIDMKYYEYTKIFRSNAKNIYEGIHIRSLDRILIIIQARRTYHMILRCYPELISNNWRCMYEVPEYTMIISLTATKIE